MNRLFHFVVVASFGLAATLGCARSSAPALQPTPGTASFVAVNRVAAPLELQHIEVSVDGQSLGTMAGNDIGGSVAERLPLARASLAEGSHTITVQANAADPKKTVVLSLRTTRSFTVGREPVVVVASISAPGGAVANRKLRVELNVEGGLMSAAVGELGGGKGPVGSCDALAPSATALCETQQMLREALADHDALRVVCLDDALREMRTLARFLEESRTAATGGGGAAIAVHHEARVAQNAEFRIQTLSGRARHCPSLKVAPIPGPSPVGRGKGADAGD